jgi:hypothetical protein
MIARKGFLSFACLVAAAVIFIINALKTGAPSPPDDWAFGLMAAGLALWTVPEKW